MTGPPSIADKPIAMGLTALLREKTRTINSECQRFVSVGDAEALHDLRVALRRLHTLFSGFSSCFSKGNDLPQRLRKLQKETNTARDLEVTLNLLKQQQLDLPQLQQQWQSALEQEYQRLHESLPPAWRELSLELDASQELLVENLPEISLAAYAAVLAGKEEKKLRRKDKLLLGKWGKKRAHRLRITGKRLRYLLEPFSEESPLAATAVARLKKFQDLLGDYHDIVVLRQRLRSLQHGATRLPAEQLERAEKSLKQGQRQLRRAFLQEYAGNKAGRLYATLKQARRDLAHYRVSTILERP